MDNIVKIKPNATGFTPYAFDRNFARVFTSNSILFVNMGATTVLINNVFPLLPSLAPGVLAGGKLTLSGNQNEVDTSVYNVAFTGAGINSLMVWIKEDAGVVDSLKLKVNYEDIDMNKFNWRTVSRELDKQRRTKRIVYEK